MKPSRRRYFWLPLYQLLAGSCDTITGLLLMFVPGWTLARMGIAHGPQPPVFAGFVGAFVSSVGMSYLYGAQLPLHRAHAPRWQMVWLLTALARSVVAVFVAAQVLLGRMENAWLSVVFTDAVLASFQWFGLWRGWLDFSD